jgi:23S rRNA pseudouridine2605 synthase
VISKRGFCSRSQAENLVREGRVSLRGKIVRDPDVPAYENDKILVDGKAVTASNFVYFMMNKPRGYVTTANDEKGRATVMDLFRERFCKMFPGKPVPHISPVGRLDAASEGLLLFTNDTKWADSLLKTKDERRKTKDAIRSKVTEHAEVPRIGNEPLAFPHTKIYRVQVNGHTTAEDLRKMEEGFNVPPRVFGEKEEFMHAVRAVFHRESEKNCWLEITLDEGKNREIRRMLAHLGYEVLRLVRIKFCNYELGNLKQGEIKEIRPNSEQTTV